MKTFVVMGTTGEYSDRDEWPVCGYSNEENAKQHVKEATRVAKHIESTRENRYSIPHGSNPYDPNMCMDYTGTDYFYHEVELRDGFERLPISDEIKIEVTDED
jgi:hypothetical protein